MAVITLTGPTCAGKSTVEAALQQLGFGRAISHTTRPARAGEVNGVNYHFITDDLFLKLNAHGDFIETIELGSVKYAMSAQSLLEAQINNEHVVIVVEPRGARQIGDFCKANDLRVLPVWVDCQYAVQAQRWLTRVLQDQAAGKPVDSSVERLGLMLSEEVRWRQFDKHEMGVQLFLDSTYRSPEQLAQVILELTAI